MKEINHGAGDALNIGIVPTTFRGDLYFSANDGVHGAELWKSAGTEAATVPVRLADNLPVVYPRVAALVSSLARPLARMLEAHARPRRQLRPDPDPLRHGPPTGMAPWRSGSAA